MKLLKSSLITFVLGYVLALEGAASAQDSNNHDAVAEENFESADTDGDGALDRDEFKAFINANAEHNLGRAKRIRRFRAFGRAFSRLDADESESVTWEEIQAAQTGE